ncbi:MAG: copper chaperone [Bacteroidetes bacterium]|nr:MAG: copper chaperone [Bacteroidota bacterium]
MKYLKLGLTAGLFLVLACTLSAQSCSGKKKEGAACCAAKASAATHIETSELDSLTTATFKVLGNCGMCKRTIETAAMSVEGVKTANWDVDSKVITLSFDAEVATVLQIHQKIAAAGYDTENIRAEDAAYQALHTCCQYERVRL